eukprot:gene21921-28966_t
MRSGGGGQQEDAILQALQQCLILWKGMPEGRLATAQTHVQGYTVMAVDSVEVPVRTPANRLMQTISISLPHAVGPVSLTHTGSRLGSNALRGAIARSPFDPSRFVTACTSTSAHASNPIRNSQPAAGRSHGERGPRGASAASIDPSSVLVDRRGVFTWAGVALGSSVMLLSDTKAADAATYLPNFFAPSPEPVMFPRKAVDQRFAVLLMNSSYKAVDSLDFVPMVRFWKLRQSEQEGYGLQYSPLKPKVGDLTDPLYFDFIAFSQYAAISEQMRKPQSTFTEFCEDCGYQKKLVQRMAPPCLATPEEFCEDCGYQKKLVQRMAPPCLATPEEFCEDCGYQKKLVQRMAPPCLATPEEFCEDCGYQKKLVQRMAPPCLVTPEEFCEDCGYQRKVVQRMAPPCLATPEEFCEDCGYQKKLVQRMAPPCLATPEEFCEDCGYQKKLVQRMAPPCLATPEEWCEDCVDQKKLVQRNASPTADAALPDEFFNLVGDNIYDGLVNGFRGLVKGFLDEVFGAPPPAKKGASVEQLTSDINTILSIMVDRGYALKANVVNVDDAGFKIKVQGSINLWGISALNYRRSVVVNSYDAMVIGAYLRASGRAGLYETEYNNVGYEQVWTLDA